MTIIPQPRITTDQSGTFTVAPSTVVSGRNGDLAAEWLISRLTSLAGMTLSRGENGTITFELADIAPTFAATTGLRADGGDAQAECYQLTVAPDGITITAPTEEGLFRGATSLIHLIAQAAGNGAATIPCGEIVDGPTYAWRGLLVDVVRSFRPISELERIVDLLALYKMNVLHMHLTDSEGWRVVVPDYPQLTEVGGATAASGRPGGFYTQAEYDAFLGYCADRFITVVPEFDSPGHTAAAIASYPELAPDDIRVLPPAMQYLHPDQPGVFAFVKAVYDEMARVHPAAWMHIGGDEAISMAVDDFHRYMERATVLARETGKGMVAWQEASRGTLQPDDIMQLWIAPDQIRNVQRILTNPTDEERSRMEEDPVMAAFVHLFSTADQDLGKALEQGATVLISRADLLYLDTRYVEDSVDASQHPTRDRLGLPSDLYNNGTVRAAYDWQPDQLDAALPADRIVGLEAAIWGETIETIDDLFFQILPRLAGVAEKGWSDQQSWDHYHPRLVAQRRLWDALQVPYFVSSTVW